MRPGSSIPGSSLPEVETSLAGVTHVAVTDENTKGLRIFRPPSANLKEPLSHSADVQGGLEVNVENVTSSTFLGEGHFMVSAKNKQLVDDVAISTATPAAHGEGRTSCVPGRSESTQDIPTRKHNRRGPEIFLRAMCSCRKTTSACWQCFWLWTVEKATSNPLMLQETHFIPSSVKWQHVSRRTSSSVAARRPGPLRLPRYRFLQRAVQLFGFCVRSESQDGTPSSSE